MLRDVCLELAHNRSTAQLTYVERLHYSTRSPNPRAGSMRLITYDCCTGCSGCGQLLAHVGCCSKTEAKGKATRTAVKTGIAEVKCSGNPCSTATDNATLKP